MGPLDRNGIPHVDDKLSLGRLFPILLNVRTDIPVVGATLRDMVNTTVDLDNPDVWEEVIS